MLIFCNFIRVYVFTTNHHLNPFLPGNPYKGHRQTVPPHNVASDQGLQCLLNGFYIKNRIKETK